MMRKLTLKQFNENVDDIAKDFLRTHYTLDNKKYKPDNILVAHDIDEFNNFIGLMNTNESSQFKIIVLYESILMNDIDKLNTSPNIEKLKSVKDKLEYVVVCGNQHSLDYLWESDSFKKIFS